MEGQQGGREGRRIDTNLFNQGPLHNLYPRPSLTLSCSWYDSPRISVTPSASNNNLELEIVMSCRLDVELQSLSPLISTLLPRTPVVINLSELADLISRTQLFFSQ